MSREPATASDAGMREYYSRRAREYERIYDKPERQADLAELKRLVAAAVSGRRVLELACGTGYWTRIAAGSARSIRATDASSAVLELAAAKDYGSCPVELAVGDAFAPADPGPGFDAGLAAFWWSHVPRSRRDEFVDGLHGRLAPGASVVLLDNRYVEGSSTPVSRIDSGGNTYQQRLLDDGSRHEVLKNFPDEAELRRVLSPRATRLAVTLLEHYWFACYSVRPRGR